MDEIRCSLREILATIPDGVSLVAVSKFHPVEALQAAYDEGQRIFGESRAPELTMKAGAMPDDVCWHFIGHLQTNKVRAVVPHVSLIHSVDSERLLRTIDSEARRIDRCVDVLLQLHVAKEETKYGFAPDELISFVESGVLEELKNVRVTGVMGMASNTDDMSRVAVDFDAIRATFERLKSGAMNGNEDFSVVSMGMSHDYQLAIERGSTMVRIGTSIFGDREY